MKKINTIGLDIAKNVFQVHGIVVSEGYCHFNNAVAHETVARVHIMQPQ